MRDNYTSIEIPSNLIPPQYIGEKFGVLLVFVKGDNEMIIKNKVKKIKEFCYQFRNETLCTSQKEIVGKSEYFETENI